MMRSPAIAAALLVAALPVAAHGPEHHSMPSVIAVAGEERLPLPNLPVTDRFGRQGGFRDSLPPGRPVILSFTYTECESLCNISNAVLMVVDASLGAGPQRVASIVTVAIDPLRDTPAGLQAQAEALGSGPDWLWLTGGAGGTRALLDALRFPPGALKEHDPMFLVGQPCLGRFTRVVGMADPAKLVELAQAQPSCAG